MPVNRRKGISKEEKAGEFVANTYAKRIWPSVNVGKGLAQGYLNFVEKLGNSLEPLGKRLEAMEEEERQERKKIEERDLKDEGSHLYSLKKMHEKDERNREYEEKLNKYEEQIKRFGKQVIPIEDIREDIYSNLKEIKGVTKDIPYEKRKTEQLSEIYDLVRSINKEVRNALNEKYPTYKRKESLQTVRGKLNTLEEILQQTNGSRLEKSVSLIAAGLLTLGLVGMFSTGISSYTGYSILNISSKSYSLAFIFSIIFIVSGAILLLKKKKRFKM
ncbi:hypothetical protein KKC91_03075 [bacterium]|nr:hypothetical protein [bacterium]